MRRAIALLLFVGAASAAYAAPACPNTIVVIACKAHLVVNADGTPALDQNDQPSYDWTVKDGIFVCKREVTPLQDAVEATFGTNGDVKRPATGGAQAAESALPSAEDAGAAPLHPDFSVPSQCGRASMSYAPSWEKAHPGWMIFSVGCPVPIVNIAPDGSETIIDWHLPECPSMLTCAEDSAI